MLDDGKWELDEEGKLLTNCVLLPKVGIRKADRNGMFAIGDFRNEQRNFLINEDDVTVCVHDRLKRKVASFRFVIQPDVAPLDYDHCSCRLMENGMNN